MDRHRQFVEKLASRKLTGFRRMIDEDGEYYDDIYRSNASLTENIAIDYRGRFLIELIQNAYDAHAPRTKDGQIDIVLDLSRGKNGTLYIANKGSPFAQGNVKDLCDMGLSKKPLGESIGNKGLGFQSVVQITDSPRIFSQAIGKIDHTRFSGFCFKFAQGEDLAALINKRQHLDLAHRDLPAFHVPIWLPEQPAPVTAFAVDGFATVIELPLRDEAARLAVEAEIIAIRDQDIPIILFLERISHLGFRMIGSDPDKLIGFSLDRNEQPLSGSEKCLSHVDLGFAGSYLLARTAVPETAMKEAIAHAIEQKQLNENWNTWKGAGEVALAVRLDASVRTPRLYTFLPMGEQATAPLPGHLHGSFFPRSNRKSLDANIALNRMLLEEATGLAARAIHHLSAEPSSSIVQWLDVDARATAVADLLCWGDVDSLDTDEDFAGQVAQKVAERFGASDFGEAPIVPCLASTEDVLTLSWSPANQARRWPDGTTSFSAEFSTLFTFETGIAPIWPALEERMDLLDSYLQDHASNYPGPPTGDERAVFVSSIAKSLAADPGTHLSTWTAFYADLPDFMGDYGEALENNRIFLGDDGKLHFALTSIPSAEVKGKRAKRRSRRETVVFSPPDPRRTNTDDDLDIDPPAKLSSRFAFLSGKLAWHDELGESRKFLEDHKLVLEFDREAVLAQLSRILAEEKNKEVLRGGLRWAFHLWRQPRATGRPFKLQPQHRFRLPSVTGDYVEARELVFSTGWPKDTCGQLLQDFLDSSPSGIPDLEDLSNRRLAAPDHPAFRDKWIEDWTEFLRELGVKSGLHPVEKKSEPRTFRAWKIHDFSFLQSYGIPIEFATLWKDDIEVQDSGLLHLPSATDYVVDGSLWWLPGQADVEQFSWECQEYYAQLIIIWLSGELPQCWKVEIHHHFSRYADSRMWPTPISAFLRSARWVPVEEPSRGGAERITVQPSEVWFHKSGGERFPTFLRRPSLPLRRALERASEELIENLETHSGLRTFNDSTTFGEQLTFLVEQFTREGFDSYFERRLLNLYSHTWALTASAWAEGELDDGGFLLPDEILVRRGSHVETLRVTDLEENESERLYVRDTEREAELRLVEASGQLLFEVKEGNPTQIGDLLEHLYGKIVTRLSKAEYTFLADGRDVGQGDIASVLDICPRMRVMVAVAMEALKGTEAQRLPADRSIVLAKLDLLKLQKAANLTFKIDGLDVSHGQEEGAAYHLSLDNGYPIVVVRSARNWDVNLIDRCISALCEAIEQRALSPHLRLLLAHFGAESKIDEASFCPDDDIDRYADILQLDREARTMARSTLSAGLERQAPWIRALLHLVVDEEAVEEFDRECPDILKDVALLHGALSTLLQPAELSADDVLSACRSALGPGDFRENLSFDFADFNASLIAVGLDPDIYPEVHKSKMENFIRDKEVAIIDALRTAYSKLLQSLKPVENYAAIRSNIREISPDPNWLVRFKSPPEEIIISKVNAWLATHGARPIGAEDADLEPLDDVRKHNRLCIQDVTKKALPLVRAWCVKFQTLIPTLWQTQESCAEKIRKKLDEVGALDFRKLGEGSLLEWIQILNLWPDEMPVSLDCEQLGLSSDDLKQEDAKAREEAEVRKREARSILFNGRVVDPEKVDLLELSNELSETLPAKMLKASLGAQSSLAPINQNPRSPKRKKPPRGSSKRRSRAPEEKTQLIGRLGEIAVYHWLNKILPKQDIDAAWRSENGGLITGRASDDGLGYDFEVTYNKQFWQIEVKASLEDPQSFEMGETEIKAARASAKFRSGTQYKIAYVSNLSDPPNLSVEMLPNPMTEEGEGVLELLGEGIRYGFKRS
ncbi:sacsin N-terminal ATP-binding-like domain-containing protein [Profundibacter amoris]|uniref:DUF3883 domain-containing protein n=1 Tax=Profundibacter amoris TaxID=2171755 RepID=A0A347UID1_9RHOB|nr:DUF3883 domain-containing protein [Profundibacter amoris]AXX98609.1 DUF3883 domain-containing protein [Profundibacter amoris]